jgi:hypothetical protein
MHFTNNGGAGSETRLLASYRRGFFALGRDGFRFFFQSSGGFTISARFSASSNGSEHRSGSGFWLLMAESV